MSDFILLDSEEKVLALKDGDRVRIDPNGREFTVCDFGTKNDDRIYFHGGWYDWVDTSKQGSDNVIYIRKPKPPDDYIGDAVWKREELWEALQTGKYIVGL